MHLAMVLLMFLSLGRCEVLVYVAKGDSIRLSCRIAPGTTVTWLFRHQQIDMDKYICIGGIIVPDFVNRFEISALDPGDYTLIAPNATFNDSGIYTCVEWDGQGETRSMFLKVTAASGHFVSDVRTTEMVGPTTIIYANNTTDKGIEGNFWATCVCVVVGISTLLVCFFALVVYFLVQRRKRERISENERTEGRNLCRPTVKAYATREPDLPAEIVEPKVDNESDNARTTEEIYSCRENAEKQCLSGNVQKNMKPRSGRRIRLLWRSISVRKGTHKSRHNSGRGIRGKLATMCCAAVNGGNLSSAEESREGIDDGMQPSTSTVSQKAIADAIPVQYMATMENEKPHKVAVVMPRSNERCAKKYVDELSDVDAQIKQMLELLKVSLRTDQLGTPSNLMILHTTTENIISVSRVEIVGDDKFASTNVDVDARYTMKFVPVWPNRAEHKMQSLKGKACMSGDVEYPYKYSNLPPDAKDHTTLILVLDIERCDNCETFLKQDGEVQVTLQKIL